jgi:hypothetical protein
MLQESWSPSERLDIQRLQRHVDLANCRQESDRLQSRGSTAPCSQAISTVRC